MKPPARRPPRVQELQVRIGESVLTKRGAARFEWRDPYHLAVGVGWWPFIGGVLAIDLALNLLFGLLYSLRPGSILNLPPGSYLDAVFFSVETLATVGYGVMAPQTLYGHLVATIEIVVGMGFTAITTGLLFVRIARPRPRLLFARQAVVTMHNGQRALMLRVGNGRVANLTSASARLTALLQQTTTEGQSFRAAHELRLERAWLPILALTWTLIHRLDDDSPLAGYDAERMLREGTRVFLGIEARDPVLAAVVHDLHTYEAQDIVYGMRFADAVTTDADGHITVDLTRLHDLEPEGGEPEIGPEQNSGLD